MIVLLALVWIHMLRAPLRYYVEQKNSTTDPKKLLNPPHILNLTWFLGFSLLATHCFPYVKKRIAVMYQHQSDLSPIEVAIDEMSTKVAELQLLCSASEVDMIRLQLKLQGSVCVQVRAAMQWSPRRLGFLEAQFVLHLIVVVCAHLDNFMFWMRTRYNHLEVSYWCPWFWK